MKAFITLLTLMALVGTVIIVADIPCGLIKFNPAAGATQFDDGQPEMPFISAENITDVEHAYQTLSVTLRTRYTDDDNNTAYGISPGCYEKKTSDDNGVTWTSWSSDDFQKDAAASKVKWYLDNDLLEGKDDKNQTYTLEDGTSKPVHINFSYETVFTTDENYLEDRKLEDDHVSTTSDQSSANDIYAYIYDGITPSGCEQGTFRAWTYPGEDWKLWRKGSSSWNHYTPPDKLPAAELL